MNNHDFKGNAPENPNVVQRISFLYVGVAEFDNDRSDELPENIDYSKLRLIANKNKEV